MTPHHTAPVSASHVGEARAFFLRLALVWMAGVAPAAAATATFARDGSALAAPAAGVLAVLALGGPLVAWQAKTRLFPAA